MEKNGLAFFQVVAIITNLSTVFRGAKIYFFLYLPQPFVFLNYLHIY